MWSTVKRALRRAHGVRRALSGLALLLGPLCPLGLAGCGGAATQEAATQTPTATLTISAFSVVREPYDRAIVPAFVRWYRQKTGTTVEVEASYGASGAQSRAVVEGFEADVVVFSMADDVERLRRAGLIRHDPEAGPHGGLVSHSVVAFAVRAGNPKGIHDWVDLTRDDVTVLTANPSTSGGAIWNIAALFGAAGREPTRTLSGGAVPAEFLRRVLRRVEIMDRSGRDSVQTFERGMGDVVLTYENEILVGQRAGQTYEQVTPRSTLRIDNPGALVDVYVDRHGRRPLAEAFLAFLQTPEAQRAFATYGLRPVDQTIARETQDRVAPVADLFTMRDLGGFSKVKAQLFSPTGIYTRAIEEAHAK
jgi:sulfate transport system substrate-binding protein